MRRILPATCSKLLKNIRKIEAIRPEALLSLD
jgi:hypothetical protein